MHDICDIFFAVVCSPGQFASPQADGSMLCLDCPRDAYNPGTRAVSCMQCPMGTRTQNTGSTSLDDCEGECGKCLKYRTLHTQGTNRQT